jgi:sterol desaturase/sphingolipid hydroxylase (fatty acid hydroxylase superfamily)
VVADGAPVVIIALLLFVALLFVLERAVPLRAPTRPLIARLAVNAAVAVTAFATAAVLVRPVTLAVLNRAADVPFGLIQFVSMPPAARFAAALLLIDLTFYWWHVAVHRVTFLWRFHAVHHIDPDLDVSTAFRFHPGEVALSVAFRAVQMAVIGPTMAMFLAYELLFQAATAFHHSNVRLPIAIERLLNLLIVTPRMHGIHHSQVPDETNSNYSVVFSCWDRLHRTLRLGVPQSGIRIGVEGFMSPRVNTLVNVLLLPVRPQGSGGTGAG